MERRLNEVVIMRPTSVSELTAKAQPLGVQIVENYVVKNSDKTIWRYAKNYSVEELEFCLFVLSYDNNNKEIERKLDEFSKKMTRDFVEEKITSVNAFEYIGGIE